MSERARPRTSSTRLAAVVTLAALSSACGGPGDGGPPKGVLLISIDSLRSDHLSCYGYESATNPSRRTTPYIDDAIAAKGTRFANVYSTTSWTLPSHMALLTGQPDHVHGVRDAPWQLETKIQPYLPKIFRDAGWTTFGIWSGPNLSPYFGFGEGFDNYVDCSQVDSSVETFDVVDEDDWKAVGATHDKSHAVVTGPKIVDTFMSWFDDIAPDERFFAFVHMWDVHYDYHAPDAFDVFYDGYTGHVRDIPFGDLNDNGIKGSISREDRLRLLSLYDAEILFTDSNIERMVDRIAAAGRLDSTLVVVLADHGEEFEEHGWYGHKFKVYEESVRIPLVFRLPGTVREGAVVDGVTSIVDVAPTILDLCEVESKAAKMWGRSLRTPLVEGTELPERLAPLELTFRNNEWYRGARGSDQKWIEMRDALRRRYHGDKVEPGEWMLKDGEYVQAVFPGVRASVWDLPQGEIEGAPARYDIARGRGLPAYVRSRGTEPEDPFVKDVHEMWREIDGLSAALADHRKRGVLDESLMEALANAGYVGMDSGAEDGSTEDESVDGDGEKDAAANDGADEKDSDTASDPHGTPGANGTGANGG